MFGPRYRGALSLPQPMPVLAVAASTLLALGACSSGPTTSHALQPEPESSAELQRFYGQDLVFARVRVTPPPPPTRPYSPAIPDSAAPVWKFLSTMTNPTAKLRRSHCSKHLPGANRSGP